MDHLIIPQGAVRTDSFYVPFLYKPEAVDVSFADYPRRYNVRTSQDLLTYCIEQPVDAATFLQKWLYFGTLSEIVKSSNGNMSSLNGFRRRCATRDRDALCTETLPAFCMQWWNRLPWTSKMNPSGKFPVVCSIIWEVSELVEFLDDLIDPKQDPLVIPVTKTLCSIKFLVEYLINTIKHFVTVPFDYKDGNPGPYYNVNHKRLQECMMPLKGPCIPRFLKDFFLSRGWCKTEINRIGSSSSLASLYYIALLPLNKGSDSQHEFCDDYKCRAHDDEALPGRYLRPHHPSCERGEGCETIGVDAVKVGQIYKAAEIPLISAYNDPIGNLRIKVEKSDENSKYVAISHVWSHGLGNPTANQVWQCQLLKLSQNVSDTNSFGIPESQPSISESLFGKYRPPEAPLFWLDTLCVPRDAQQDQNEMKASRRIALTYMDEVYSRATLVLVRDSMLMSLSQENLPLEQIFAYISCSDWMNRCWTLSESALGLKVVFQFADGFFNPEEKYRELNVRGKAGLKSALNFLMDNKEGLLPEYHKFLLKSDLSSFYAVMPASGPIRTSSSQNVYNGPKAEALDQLAFLQRDKTVPWWSYSRLLDFAQSWNALLYRQTTEPKDMEYIQASLYRFSVWDQIHSAKIQNYAMKLVLKDQKDLPIHILFHKASGYREDQKETLKVALGKPPNIQPAKLENKMGQKLDKPGEINSWAPVGVADSKLDLTLGLMKPKDNKTMELRVSKGYRLNTLLFKNEDILSRQLIVQITDDMNLQHSICVELDEEVGILEKRLEYNHGCILIDPSSKFLFCNYGFKARGAYMAICERKKDGVRARYLCAATVRSSCHSTGSWPMIGAKLVNPEKFAVDCDMSGWPLRKDVHNIRDPVKIMVENYFKRGFERSEFDIMGLSVTGAALTEWRNRLRSEEAAEIKKWRKQQKWSRDLHPGRKGVMSNGLIGRLS